MDTVLIEPKEWSTNHIEHHKQINENLINIQNAIKWFNNSIGSLSWSDKDINDKIKSLNSNFLELSNKFDVLQKSVLNKLSLIEWEIRSDLDKYLTKNNESYQWQFDWLIATPWQVIYHIFEYDVIKTWQYIIEVIENEIKQNKHVSRYEFKKKRLLNLKSWQKIDINCALYSSWGVATLRYNIDVLIYKI